MRHVVIIPVHNQLSFLKKCVDSILKKSDLDLLQLIIVNDGSTDKETSEWIDNFDFINYYIIRHNTAKGFSKACNDGIDYAIKNFDFNCLCLLNSDAEIITDKWFTKVENQIMEKNASIASVVSNNAGFQTIYNVPQYIANIDSKPTLYTKLPHGFCYFINKHLILTIGRFDEYTFPHYGSEDDYSLKAIKEGFKNILVGSVLINHNAATSYAEDIRKEHLKLSMPNLRNRWGDVYVRECVNELIANQKKLNE